MNKKKILRRDIPILVAIIGAIAVLVWVVNDHMHKTVLKSEDKIVKQWSSEREVTDQSIDRLINTIKQNNEDVKAIAASFVNNTDPYRASVIRQAKFTGNLEMQIVVRKGLTSDQQIRLGKDLMSVLFQNKNIKRVGLTLYPEGHPRRLVQMSTNKRDFEQNHSQELSAGLERLMVIN